MLFWLNGLPASFEQNAAQDTDQKHRQYSSYHAEHDNKGCFC